MAFRKLGINYERPVGASETIWPTSKCGWVKSELDRFEGTYAQGVGLVSAELDRAMQFLWRVKTFEASSEEWAFSDFQNNYIAANGTKIENIQQDQLACVAYREIRCAQGPYRHLSVQIYGLVYEDRGQVSGLRVGGGIWLPGDINDDVDLYVGVSYSGHTAFDDFIELSLEDDSTVTLRATESWDFRD